MSERLKELLKMAHEYAENNDVDAAITYASLVLEEWEHLVRAEEALAAGVSAALSKRVDDAAQLTTAAEGGEQ